MTSRLFVGNLPDNAKEGDIRAAFSIYGEIVNLDLKCKPSSDEAKEQKRFAFVTLSGSNYDIESCIKHFSSEDFNGTRLYVTRARESFLERLQRERAQTQKTESFKDQQAEISPKKNPVIKLGDKLNPRKRKITTDNIKEKAYKENGVTKIFEKKTVTHTFLQNGDGIDQEVDKIATEKDKKKHDSEKKRLESMKQKRQEFRAKQMIIKTGLTGVDKAPNKKVIFSDNEETQETHSEKKRILNQHNKNMLFCDDESDDEVNFEIKKQFEGKQGQKVLDLQSRYKSDKRFILDERFIEESNDEDTEKENNEDVEIGPSDEKMKQLNILQDVLGVEIKSSSNRDLDGKKSKPKLGMLRFDPSHPDHAKFIIPKEEIQQEVSKKIKKKLKEKPVEKKEENPQIMVEKVEASKEQFYKVTETLKEAIAQPNTFSLRSLFPTNEENSQGTQEQETNYIPLETSKQQKAKNPLEPGEKNPFVYDSSDSENEDDTKNLTQTVQPVIETKAVWKEKFFFSQNDDRLKDGLVFFNRVSTTEGQKERRELKFLVKKRIYNKERKNQMFQKKIGGHRKSVKKSFRKKN